MKNFLFLFLFLFTGGVFSQSKNATQKISKVELLKAERITDLIKDIPVDCKVTGYLFKMTQYKEQKENGKVAKKENVSKIKCVGNELRIDMQDLFKTSEAGDTFSFDKMETACLEKHKKKYLFEISN